MPTIRVCMTEAGLKDDSTTLRGKMRGNYGTPPVEISFSDDDLDLISEDLEWEADDAIRAIERYANGGFREKSKGPSETIGPLNEAICYIYLRSKNWDVERIVSYNKNAADQEKYPHPDFIAHHNKVVEIIECKATLAFDYSAMRLLSAKSKPHVCLRLIEAKKSAFSQLGYNSKGKKKKLKHKMKTASKKLIPFPAVKTWAFTSAFVDGRIPGLNIEIHAPSDCSGNKPSLKCTDCTLLSSATKSAHAMTVLWSNHPDALWALPGDRETSLEFFRAYRKWRRALWSREPQRVQDATSMLTTLVRELSPRRHSDALVSHYLEWAAGEREHRQLGARVVNVEPGELPLQPGTYTFPVAESTGVFEVRPDGAVLRVDTRRPFAQGNTEEAVEFGAQMLVAGLSALLGVGPRVLNGLRADVGLQQAIAAVDERALFLGWVARSWSLSPQQRLDLTVTIHSAQGIGVPFDSLAFRWLILGEWKLLLLADGRAVLRLRAPRVTTG